MSNLRDRLVIFDEQLRKDEDQFHGELQSSRVALLDFLDRSIDELRRLKEEHQNEFNYLDEENRRTCSENRQQFDRLCRRLDQNETNPTVQSQLIDEFQTNFPRRPQMLENIPQFDLPEIRFESLIQRKEKFKPSIVEERKESPRPVSVAHQSRVDLAFRIAYKHNQHPALMDFDPEEKTLLIYSPSTKRLEFVSLAEGRVQFVNCPWKDSVLTMGYSSSFRRFYFVTSENCRLIHCRVRDGQIDVAEECPLIDEHNERFSNLICGHLHTTDLHFISRRSARLHFVKYHLRVISSIALPSVLHHDEEEHSSFAVIDFTVNPSHITLLVQLNNASRYVIVVCDEQLNPIHSFDLIEAKKPLTMISIFEEEIGRCLIFINDPQGHQIHCCNEEHYLISIEINPYGICALTDGNLALISKRDIRGLNIQDHLH